MRNKILITGVNGFIGSAFWKYIKKHKPHYEPYGLDVKITSPTENILSCNLNHRQRLKSILMCIKPDYIFHFAGGRMTDERKIFESNFLTTKYLLATIKEIKNYSPRIIIPGSAAEYGIPRQKGLVKEKCKPYPKGWYGFVKCMQTNLCLAYSKKGLDIVIGRIFNITGTGTPPLLVIGQFSKQIALIEKGRQEKVICTKNLNSKRDFLDIDDICSALLLMAQVGKRGEIYNICSSQSYTIRALLKELLSLSTVQNIAVEEGEDVSSESYDVIGSNQKLRKTTRWKPTVSIKKSLKRTLNYYRGQR